MPISHVDKENLYVERKHDSRYQMLEITNSVCVCVCSSDERYCVFVFCIISFCQDRCRVLQDTTMVDLFFLRGRSNCSMAS